MIDLPQVEEPELAHRLAWTLLLVVLAAHFVVGGILQALDLPFGLGFTELFILALPTVLAVRAQNHRPVAFLALGWPGAAPVLVGALVGGVGFFFAGSLNSIGVQLLPEDWARDLTPIFDVDGSARKVLLLVAVAGLAPLGEEIVFRGNLLRVLRARYGLTPALILTSLVFAAIHLNPAATPALFALGLVFALLRILSGSLWPAIVAHAVQNGTTSALFLLGLTEQSPDELSLAAAGAMLAVATPLLVLSLALLRRVSRPEAPVVLLDPADTRSLRLSRVRRPAWLWAGSAALTLVLWGFLSGPQLTERARALFDASPQDAADAEQR